MKQLTLRQIFFVSFLVLILAIGFQSFMILANINESRTLINSAVPYERIKNNAPMRILIIGDSTALGVGALSPLQSVAGRIGSRYPDSSVTTVANAGARIADIARTLTAMQKDQFDIVLIQVGANDIIRFTSKSTMRRGVDTMLTQAKLVSKNVLWMSSGNIGSAPFFSFPASIIMGIRTRSARELFIESSKEHQVYYVDLYRSKLQDPFLKDKNKYFASDMLHPSGEGYGIWFDELKLSLDTVMK